MHARRAFLAGVLCAVWAYMHCASYEPVPRATVDEDMPPAEAIGPTDDAPRTIEELRTRVAGVLARERLPGVALALVTRDGPIWIGGVGVRDLETGAPVEADTVFRVGSLAKSLVTLGVMRLADQGKLDIDRPLREILPGVVDNPWEATSPVTIAQLLEHTSGIDEVRFTEVFTDDERLSVADTLALNPRSRRVRWRPGTRHAYSNVGATIAARAIEVVTGEPFDVYLQREILGPLGITRAAFYRTDDISRRLATGYGQGQRPAKFQAFAHRPGGALLASADDLAKLVRFYLARGEGFPPILSKAAFDRIEKNGTLPYGHLDSDYGLANYGDVSAPVLARGHDGGMPGFHASIRYFPSLGGGYVMLLNSSYMRRGYKELRKLLYGYLARGHAVPSSPPSPSNTAPGEPGASFFSYASPSADVFGFIDRALMGFAVARTDSGLRVTGLGGEGVDLLPTASGAYRVPDECGTSVRFATADDGTPIMVNGFMYAEAESSLLAHLRYLGLGLAMLLLQWAPLWSVAVLLFSAMQRRRVLPTSLVAWPAVAGLTCYAFPHVLDAAFESGVIGIVHPWTVTFFGLTLLLPLASLALLYSSIRWSRRPDRPPLYWRAFPITCALAFSGLSLWLGVHGWVGLRVWAW